MPRQAQDLTGKTFAGRQVISQAPSRESGGNKIIYWHVRCIACGNLTEVQGNSLKRGSGCQSCFHRNKNDSKSKPTSKKRISKKTQSPSPNHHMTVKDVIKALSKVPPDHVIKMHLMGKLGWTIQPIKSVGVVRDFVLFVADLPEKVEPWKN